MKVVVCEDTDWLLSEEAFSIYASCMYHSTYEDYKTLMEVQPHERLLFPFRHPGIRQILWLQG